MTNHQLSDALEGLLSHLHDDMANRAMTMNDDDVDSTFLSVVAQELFSRQQHRPPEESSTNVRDILGDSTSQLVELLAPLLQDRVHLQALMPCTQDLEAEREVLENHKNAQMLTLTALHAGWLYAQLLSLPGALGSGLVDLELLSSLGSLMRRWSLETCGRETELQGVVEGTTPYPPSPSKSPPKKRTKHDEEDDDDPTSLSILKIGLNIARAVTLIPLQKEFAAWSFEAKEQVFEALSAAFGTAAALHSVLNDSYANTITSQASKAWLACLLHTSAHKTRQHETAVLIARGLLHLLQFKDILPCGEKGKLDAHLAASTALQDLMEGFTRQYGVASNVKAKTSLGDATNTTPARRRRRSSGGLLTPATSVAKTPGRRRRSSVESVVRAAGPNNGALMATTSTSTTLLSPAALKGRRSSVGIPTPFSDHAKPRPIWSVFVGLLQKISTTAGMERATSRTPTIDCLLRCIPALPLAERAHFLRYILKLTKSKVSLHRLVACELLGKILAHDWLSTHQDDHVLATDHFGHGSMNPETPDSQDSQSSTSLPLALWEALQGRLVDKLAPVRARAAASVQLALEANPEWLNEDCALLLNQLRKRALKDDTATVRKAALSALCQLLHSQPDYLTDTSVTAICELCQDESVLTRKVAIESLSNLLTAFLDHPTASLLEQAWSTCVLPLILQDDVATKAIASLNQVLIIPLLEFNHDTATSSQLSACNTAWRLLAHVASVSGSQGASKGARYALQMGLKQMAIEDADRIYKDIWKMAGQVAQSCLLQAESSEAHIMGVWCLMESLLSSATTKQVKAMVASSKRSHHLGFLCGTAWKTLLDRCRSTHHAWLMSTLRSCLVVVTQLAPGLDAAVTGDILSDLSRELAELSFRPEVTGAAVSALSAISIRLDGDDARATCQDWIQATYLACQIQLTDSVKDELTDRAVRALFLVGELNMVGFRPDDDEKNERVYDVDVLRGMHVPPPFKLRELVQTLLSPTLPGSSTTCTPTSIRAHAFTVLGKLCLRDESLAKQSLNIMARELHPSSSNPNSSVQSNALIVLGDLCVRYTNMADRYLPVMASCLQAGASDPEVSVLASSSPASIITRKHAVLLLSSLLLQDYIKWRGLLFHRFLVACSDEDEQVATLAESVLSGTLSTRQPKLFFNHFVEALFVLNKCTAHPIYISAASQGDGGSGIAVGFEGIHLNGEVGRLRRRRMYEFMLSKLSDEEKIGVTARLAKDVLAEAVSQEGDLFRVCQSQAPEQLKSRELGSAWNVLTDALYILTCPGLKVGKGNNEEDDSNLVLDDPNVVPNANRQVTMAKTRLLSKISRKHLIEIVLPIVCQLKTQLQSSCSPLLKDLQIYMLDIFRRYKAEVKEFLANDPVLLQEMEYDARKTSASARRE